MSDTFDNRSTPLNDLPDSANSEELHIGRAKFTMTVTGYIMLVAAILMFAALAYRSIVAGVVPASLGEDENFVAWLLTNYFADSTLVFGAVFFSVIGLNLLRSSGRGKKAVIPDEDRELLEPLISTNKKEEVDLYVVVSSLSGATGAFRKIGFTGLPLATITVTLLFSLLSFFEKEFLELAKLTLGAFIGSFVQKGVDESRRVVPSEVRSGND